MPRRKQPKPVSMPSRPQAQCEPCGYKWSPRTENLGRCPKCGEKQGIHLLEEAA